MYNEDVNTVLKNIYVYIVFLLVHSKIIIINSKLYYYKVVFVHTHTQIGSLFVINIYEQYSCFK